MWNIRSILEGSGNVFKLRCDMPSNECLLSGATRAPDDTHATGSSVCRSYFDCDITQPL